MYIIYIMKFIIINFLHFIFLLPFSPFISVRFPIGLASTARRTCLFLQKHKLRQKKIVLIFKKI